MFKLYDTLKGEIIDFSPRKKGQVSIYACGPTVYDVPHLGHARTAITYDVMTRYLEWLGQKVTLVVNITDIDDKIIARAKETGVTESEIADKYLKIYLEQMFQLNIRPPDFQPRATQYISQMQDFILKLLEKNAAYVAEGLGIYFDVEAFGEYGNLVHRSIQDLAESGQGRIEADDRKKNQLDFALWKIAKAGEPSWEWETRKDLPAGRPGWHIECVAMSLGELGEGFDIHGGGSDLIFPHHENERAEALAGENDFARYWVHSGMVSIAGRKMAKSEGNFITLENQLNEIESRAFRLAVLQTHYRSEMEITPDTLEASKSALERIADFARNAAIQDISPAKKIKKSDRDNFTNFMNNDFATPSALGVIFDLVSEGNRALKQGLKKRAAACLAGIYEFSLALGVELEIPAKLIRVLDENFVKEWSAEIKQLIEDRKQAREDRDYKKSDEIRERLAAEGLFVQDTPEGSFYFAD